ncbi:MAG: CPBP family intramembrane metalloprotease, partial [Bdellovibrionales bacterium]|nr:CPBP family intramembrane metalloprotease [Bdellovibrionales bacterium]
DKPFFGVVFFALSAEAVRSRKSWGQVLKAVSMVLPLAVATVLGGALVLGWLSLQSTPLPDWTAIWIFKNLFLTVIAEEALFRGLIQRELKERLPHKWSRLSLPLSALLFGLAHFSGGGRYIAAASLAGVFYGWAWERSGGRLEAAILCHFGLNLCHFFFLTYPQ